MGLVVGVMGIVLVVLYMRRFEQEASGGRRIQLLVTVQPIARGKAITDEMLGVRDVPQAYVDDRSIRAVEKEKVLNLSATSTIPVGQTLAWTDIIASTDEQRDLSSLVQPGNRAMPIRVRQDDILSLIKPGDFIDLIGVVGAETKDATVLLQRVLVLAAGLDTTTDKTAEKKRVDKATMLTVSVSLQEGQLLALAMEKGQLTVVVRNPDDQRILETPPDVTQTALTDSAKRQALSKRRAPGASGPVRLETANPNP